jgi:hypothetical protein
MTNPARAKYARERADALLPKVGVVVLEIGSPQAAGLDITVNDHKITPDRVVREIVDPGAVEISANARGAEPFRATEEVAAGKTVKVTIPAFPDAGGGGVGEDKGRTVRRRSRVYIAYGLGAAGALSLVSGVAIGLAANADYQAQFENGECMDVSPSPICTREGADAQNEARSLATVGTILGVGGIALAAGAAVVFFTAPRDLVVTPTASSQTLGLAVVGNF